MSSTPCPMPGGQCAELYGDKPIYDIPAIAACTGHDLTQRLCAQIAPFAPTWHLGQQVDTVAAPARGRFRRWHDGVACGCRRAACSSPAGVGAFVPRTLKTEGLAQHQGRQLHYHPVTDSLGALCAARHTVVHGGDEAAVAAALRPVPRPCAPSVIRCCTGAMSSTPQARAAAAAAATARQPAASRSPSARSPRRAARRPAAWWRCSCTRPRARRCACRWTCCWSTWASRRAWAPIADWGLQLDRKQIVVDTASFQTSESGIYAVGDVNHYPGKRKLILCGFHEATLAAFAAAEQLAGHSLGLEYTTSSARLQQLLAPAV